MHVDHVESSGVGDSPELGETLHVTTYVSLGDLTPDDVEVQVVHGRTNHHGDELHDVSSVPLAHVESYEHGRHQFSGDLVLRSSGAFGYTVRVLPKHAGWRTRARWAWSPTPDRRVLLGRLSGGRGPRRGGRGSRRPGCGSR